MGWRFPIFGAAIAALLLFSLFLFAGDPVLWVLFLIAPCVGLLALVLLVLLAFRRTRRRSGELLLATVLFLAIMIIGLRFQDVVRPDARWAFFSQKFKRQVLSQQGCPSGDFKHFEWDGSGGAPVGDWTSYVVFDPTDSLNAETHHWNPGEIKGIPCDVLRIQKLEKRWYSVTLQMNEWWDTCRNYKNAQTTE